jgi:hypothetical protein
MSNSDRKTLVAFGVFAVGFALFCFWLVLSYTDAVYRAEVRINDVIPRWLIIANFLVLLCIAPIAAGPLRIRPDLRAVLLTLTLFSVMILVVTFRRYFLESCGVLAVSLLEAYWIIPKWDARHRRVL